MPSQSIKRDVVVIGASVGGVPILRYLCGALPEELPAVVGIVLHRGSWYGGNVTEIYGQKGRITVREASTGTRLERGTVYFVPSDHHMEFQETHIRLSRGPKVHFSRPAIDPLFFSAARTFGTGVVGILINRRQLGWRRRLCPHQGSRRTHLCAETG
jgi:two-component system, chemotaxis family, protein-glutamate methylesterase/glutaminase